LICKNNTKSPKKKIFGPKVINIFETFYEPCIKESISRCGGLDKELITLVRQYSKNG
jgi:hypothetical protein